MAFDIIGARGYGSSEQGDQSNPATFNHFATVTAKSSTSITVDDATYFPIGTEILLHIAGAKNSSAQAQYLGLYKFAKVMSVSGNVLTLSTSPLDISTTNYFYQAVSVPHFNILTISETIAPPAFNDGVGGLLVFKAQRLNLSGAINLVDKGLNADSQRPLSNQEQNGTLDKEQLSAYENYDTATHLTLQKGDGACLIIAKRIDFTTAARIGDPNSKGIARCRNAEDSVNRNSSYTNIGGSSIAIIAETINSFSPNVISKYRAKSLATGKGLARCYIATESRLPFDEGLYSYDIISKPERLAEETLIDGVGDGSLGTASSSITKQQNNYAKVTAITNAGKTFSLTQVTTAGIAPFAKNALVMIHASLLNTSNLNHVGRFFIAKCVGVTNDSAGKLQAITLDRSINELALTNFTTEKYAFQAISIPQYSSFNAGNQATPEYKNGRGGIFAIAVNGICDLTGKVINVVGAGGSRYYPDSISNATMKNRLPIGQGHGSIFILAKTLKVNSATRLGATYSGNSFGGNSRTHDGGGFQGEGHDSIAGGSGLRGGVNQTGHNGGFFSNATDAPAGKKLQYVNGGRQGASIFIVAETIQGMCLDCLSTGGEAGNCAVVDGSPNSSVKISGSDGGCGYGGGGATFNFNGVINNEAGAGGVHGGGSGDSFNSDSRYSYGGGASGFCVIYVGSRD